MNFKDLKTGTKILSGFLTIILIAVIIGIIALLSLRNVSNSFHEVADDCLPSIQYLGGMESNLERVNKGYIRLLDTQLSRAEREEVLQQIQHARSEYLRYNELFENLPQSEEEVVIYRQLLQDLQEWQNINTTQVDRLHQELMAIDLMNPMEVNKDLEQFMKDHYALQVETVNAIQTLRAFEGGDDATRCNFGQWLPDFRTNNGEINQNLNALLSHHDNFHASVHRIKQLIQQGNRDAAFNHYMNVMAPAAENVFNYFAVINREAQRAVDNFNRMSLIISNESTEAYERSFASFDYLKDYNVRVANEEITAGDAITSRSYYIIIAGLVIGVIIALALSFWIARLVTSGITQGVEIAQTIADGNLVVNIDKELLKQKDEVGLLSNAMQQMIEKLREVIGGVVGGSDNIAAASQQMSSTAQEMSQGSTEQASSAEEVSSSMEEMAANIQQNTDNARETEKIARNVSDGVKEVGGAAEESLQSIRMIASKISIIGEISRQTNILALNAAVEAARAGEHGKGFAVVAAEVRKLAESSKVAADEINGLASQSVSVTEKAGELMKTIIPEINKTAQLVQEIAAASIEQNSGANQVNSAIQQLNQVTQQNAAASEEMATSSEELASQADQLLEMVSYFKLDTALSKTKKKPNPAVSAVGNLSRTKTSNGENFRKNENGNRNIKGVKLNMTTEVSDTEYEQF